MSDLSNLGGWIDDPGKVEDVIGSLPMPYFAAAAPGLFQGDTPETVLLYKAFKDVLGTYPSYQAQLIGDCIGFGFAHGVDLLACIEIAIGKEPEAFKYTSTEAVYGMARVDIGRGQLGNSDGAVGAWAAKAISTLGTVSREVAGEYSGSRAKSWGRSGVPAEFKTVALNHKVKTVSLVTTYAELEASIANGYPVPVCSNQGFTMVRDADGFCRASGSWAHCMLIVGIRGGNRPGACIMQSWGPNTPSGPLALDQPDNTFWADKDVVARMLAARDSWAISSFDGYPGRPMPSKWSYSAMA